jgi:hypothetical protein
LEATIVPGKPRNFIGDDVVSNFEIEEDDTCIEDNIIMSPPFSQMLSKTS